ncbi:MAG: OmpH family outer membrane protein [Cytophagales bacterium]|nr:OmpH family outer membrane protein [Cytophagales bacterium]
MKLSIRLLLTLLFAVLYFPLRAQTGKVGYVDFEALYNRHPDAKPMKEQLEADKQKLQKDLQGRQSTLEHKSKAYQATLASADTTARRQARQQMLEVMQFSEQVQQEYKEAYKALAEKEGQLKRLVEQKVRKAIEEVALEQGYASILSLREAYAYSPAANLTEAVLLKLGTK